MGIPSHSRGKKGVAQKTPAGVVQSHEVPRHLDGAVVVVSGASSGIGEGIAMECAHRGAKLILTARRLEQLERVAVACRGAGALDVAIVAGDVRNEDIAQQIVDAAYSFGGVDRLYVNAGISQNTHFMDAPLSTVREQMEVNFFGGVLLARACLPSLLERRGRIAAVTSLQGRLPAPRNTGYSASKHAMHGFFESLRQEIEPKGVKVTMVMPGPVDTDILSNLQGPGGNKVALVLSNAEKQNMTSAREAGRIAVDACEKGVREVAFPKNMASLMQLRATDPDKVDAIMGKVYETMETREVSPASKL